MAWRLAYSLEQLRNELNAQFPHRDKSSDGAIGDTAHAATASDHNPNAAGVVCAYDIDTDLDGTDDSNDPDMLRLCEWFRTHPHPDLKYVIYGGRMFSSYARDPYPPFAWRPYTGADPHTNHAHVSVGTGRDGRSVQPYDDTNLWGVEACFINPAPHPLPALRKAPKMLVFQVTGGGFFLWHGGTTWSVITNDGVAPGGDNVKELLKATGQSAPCVLSKEQLQRMGVQF